MASFLKTCFAGKSTNMVRQKFRNRFGGPCTATTACPNLDKLLKGNLSALTKLRDKQLAKTQALLLDAIGRIVFLLEELEKGSLHQKPPRMATQTALRFLGNASCHTSSERKKSVLNDPNPRMSDMADEDELYTNAPRICLVMASPRRKAKERDEELKVHRQADRSQFFQRDRPFKHGGSSGHQLNRGKRFTRSQPYLQRGSSP